LKDADACDVVLTVFARVCRAIKNIDCSSEAGAFRRWLGLIAHQQVLRYWCKDQELSSGAGGKVGDSLRDSMQGEVDPIWIETFNAYIYERACLNVRCEFDDATWRMFELVWERGMSVADVAQETGSQPWAVYQAKCKVMQRLGAEVARLSSDAPVPGTRSGPNVTG
jgi:RNA polymerase sigma-70 factor (ECF subfamily)